MLLRRYFDYYCKKVQFSIKTALEEPSNLQTIPEKFVEILTNLLEQKFTLISCSSLTLSNNLPWILFLIFSVFLLYAKPVSISWLGAYDLELLFREPMPLPKFA